MEYMALATGISVTLLSGMTGSAIMEYSHLIDALNLKSEVYMPTQKTVNIYRKYEKNNNMCN